MRRRIISSLAQFVSVLVGWFTLLSIFVVHVGLEGMLFAALATVTLLLATLVRYVAVYHRFSRSIYRTAFLVPLTVTFLAVGGVTVQRLDGSVSVSALRSIIESSSFDVGSAHFLPEWWIAPVLALAGVLFLFSLVQSRPLSPYPKPGELREVSNSPAYFGCFCAFFGLWSVLFVGIGIQRVLVLAPIFEELLKFGVALAVGSVLFGRSFTARVGVALVVGTLFGLIEHATTYPAEADSVYLLRTAFHALTTVVSVATFTAFESLDKPDLRWIAPAYSVLLHFFYNTFVTLSALIGIVLFDAQSTLPALIYGGATIVVASVLFVIVVASKRTLVAIHAPLRHVLSDVV